MDRRKEEAHFCVEHEGYFSGRGGTCAVCGAEVCHNCAMVLKKHKPCPKIVEQEKHRVLMNAIKPVILGPTAKELPKSA